MKKIINTKSILLLSALLLIGCGSSTNTTKIKIIESELERKTDPFFNEKARLTSDNNKFAFALFEKINGDQKENNIFFSPYSISRSLAKITLGADRPSKDEIDFTANFIMSYNGFHKKFNALDLWLNYSDANYTFAVSNSMWLQKGTHISNDYLDGIKVNYGDNIKTLNYSKNADKSINSWVRNDTKGRISDIVPKNSINQNTKFILTDTAYFQNSWFYSFDKKKTQNDIFYMLDGNTKTVPFMYQGGGCIHYPYYKSENYELLDLNLAPWSYSCIVGGERKYHNRSTTSMIIIIPDADEFDNVLENIESIYTESKDNLSEQEMTVRLPKFSFMTPSYDMKKYLKDMGIDRIFENNESLEKMSNDENIKIDGMFHKTFIAVDEQGVEAKSTSNGIMTCEGFTDKIVHFNANRPFIFFIKDERTEQILFIGVVRQP